jgi:hypothetical protein
LPPGLSWEDNQYQAFRLVDEDGESFPVAANSMTTGPQVIVDTASGRDPTTGRFTLVRQIPAATWDGAGLVVEDDDWAQVSGDDTWQGWTLWDADGNGYRLRASGSDTASSPARVILSPESAPCSPAPCTANYTLSHNPWLAALAQGKAPAGDADATTAQWDRTFTDGSHTLGQASVQAEEISPGSYRLKAVGTVGRSRHQVVLTVHRSGQLDQRVTDWKVGDGT